jgi:hypothetical protein
MTEEESLAGLSKTNDAGGLFPPSNLPLRIALQYDA